MCMLLRQTVYLVIFSSKLFSTKRLDTTDKSLKVKKQKDTHTVNRCDLSDCTQLDDLRILKPQQNMRAPITHKQNFKSIY